MWDCEGKESDTHVVRKLLTSNENFFRKKELGRDVFLTLRVPNPDFEKAEAKILLETLENIPRSYDAAKLFYKKDQSPIFEVILPMTTSALCIERIRRYYNHFVIGKQNMPLSPGDITTAQWIGDFMPKSINVIPLFEDWEHMLNAHAITREYTNGKSLEYQRVFLARSDPAVNYGLVSAVLLNKIALQRLEVLSKTRGTKIYPIIGVGSAPFRGNLRPQTADRVSKEYPSVYTFTIQSSFKYDNPPEKVMRAIDILRERKVGAPQAVDESKCLEIAERYSAEYRKQISVLAPSINEIARHIPSRRKRKLHMGLFGYSREVEGVKLPRAITFTAALYSIGIPPEVFGLSALSTQDIDFLKQTYINFEADLAQALRYLDMNSPLLPESTRAKIKELKIDFQPDEEHQKITAHISESLGKERHNVREHVLSAANLRGFLG